MKIDLSDVNLKVDFYLEGRGFMLCDLLRFPKEVNQLNDISRQYSVLVALSKGLGLPKPNNEPKKWDLFWEFDSPIKIITCKRISFSGDSGKVNIRYENN